jgi:membrane-associated phospholipid phosphatase
MEQVLSDSDEATRKRYFVPLWLFVAIMAIIGEVAVWPFDLQISQYYRTTKIPSELNKLVNISEAFAHGTGIAVILLTLFWMDIPRRKSLLIVTLIVILSSVASNTSKRIYPRLRPHTDHDVFVVSAADSWTYAAKIKKSDSTVQSFPSGHSAATIAFAIGLAFVYPRGRWIFLSLAVLACFQRVLCAAHYPTDVFAGAFVGCAVAGLVLNKYSLSLLTRSGGIKQLAT